MKIIFKVLFLAGMMALPIAAQAQWTPPSSSQKEAKVQTPPPAMPPAPEVPAPEAQASAAKSEIPPPVAPPKQGMTPEAPMYHCGMGDEHKVEFEKMREMMMQMHTQIGEMHKMMMESAAKK